MLHWVENRGMEFSRSTGGVVQSSWLDLPLLIEGQLLSQEQNLRAQGCARAEQETEEKKPVLDQICDQVKQRIQALCSERIETWPVRMAQGRPG